ARLAEVVDLDRVQRRVGGVGLAQEPLVRAGAKDADVVDVWIVTPAADHRDVTCLAEVADRDRVGGRVAGVGGAQVPGAGAGPEDADVLLAGAQPVAADGDVAAAAEVADLESGGRIVASLHLVQIPDASAGPEHTDVAGVGNRREDDAGAVV